MPARLWTGPHRSPMFLPWLALGFLLLVGVPGQACSLAEHSWAVVGSIDLPLDAPLALIDLVDRLGRENPATHPTAILWAHPRPEAALPAFLIHEWTRDRAGLPPLSVQPPNGTLLAEARSRFRPGPVPLLMSTDLTRLRLALFVDRNSPGTVFQAVAVQEGRCRAILPALDRPWALELPCRTWISLTFHLVPAPGHLLSFSGFPFDGAPVVLWDDDLLVKELIGRGTLARRLVLPTEPVGEEIPLLPGETR